MTRAYFVYFVARLVRGIKTIHENTTTKKQRQATLAIACLYLNLAHLNFKGGQVRGGVYARPTALAIGIKA